MFMKKNNFLKFGKIFLSSILVSIYSSIGGISYGENFQRNNQTATIISLKNDNKSLENKMKSIENNKNNIKNDLKIYSKNVVTRNSLDEKKSEETSNSVKKDKSFPQKILKKAKYLILSVVGGIGCMFKNKLFQKKGKRKYDEVNPQQLENHEQKFHYMNQRFSNNSSFHSTPDDDYDYSETPKFFPTTTWPKKPSSDLKKYETETTTDDGNLDDTTFTDEGAPPVGNEDLNAPEGANK